MIVSTSERLPEHSGTGPQNNVEIESNIFRGVPVHLLTRKSPYKTSMQTSSILNRKPG